MPVDEPLHRVLLRKGVHLVAPLVMRGPILLEGAGPKIMTGFIAITTNITIVSLLLLITVTITSAILRVV